MKFIDPLKDIKKSDLPIIVFSDDMRGFLGWGIKAHSKGVYNHAMAMIVFEDDIPCVDTQVWVYKRLPITHYMTNSVRLKFVKIKGLTDTKEKALYTRIKKALSQKWWKRRYDFAGILGQLFKVKFINNPGMYYCSERVADDLKVAGFKNVPYKPSPSQLNNWMKTQPARFEVLGYWFMD